jgi:predicted O-linked N-acetylglucosamine transferase (SPINDLY family)/molybdenum cofactor biosynthesis enzyme MoaA
MNKLAVTPFAQDSQTHGKAPNRQQLLQQLAQLWQQGATQACFDIALLLTSEFPREGIAWKILGGLLQQRGDLPGASEALAQAVKLLKKDAEVFLNAANVAAQLGESAQAIKHYRQAIRLNPSLTRAYANLASLLKADDQHKEAEKLLRAALQVNQQDALVLFDLAALLHESGKSLEAVQYYRQALEIEPGNAVLAYNMAQVLFVLGNLDEAIVHFQRAIDLEPTYFDALHQLGHCLRQKNQFKEAEQVWLQARTIQPDHWQLLNDLAQLYKQLQQPAEYEACAKAIMQVKAPDIEALNNFTSTLINQQLLNEAERYCKQAFSLGVEDPFTYSNMALLLYYKQEYAQSLGYYEKALQLKPDCAPFWSNYSVSLRLLGEVERARQALEKAIAIDPDYLDSYINLGSAYLEQGDIKLAVETYVKLIARAPHLDKAYRNLLYTNSFANELSQKAHLKYARACGELFMSKAEPFKNWMVNAQDQRLRIGLVSADLRSHPVGYFLEHWLKHVDAGKTEIYAYSTDGREDAYSQALKKYCCQWRSLAGMNDARAANLIREDGIHILLDLSGYTADSRVSLFAWRPAPVQASWLGYWDTTGIPAMDVVIADPVSVPAGSEGQFTETVVKLPHTRLCFSAPQSDEQINALPALKNGYVTFGCFQKYSKVSDEVLAVWAQVFKALPNAKLYWQCKAFQDDQVQAEALARLQKAGIQAQQCVLMRPTARDAYFKSYHAVDLILDSFPFNGGTTTCEALWMGVPTLTMPGETMISRQGASMMTSAGLPDWVAADKQAFVQKAIQFATDVPALANLRAGLRAQVMHSPLMDGERFARDMEQLLSNLWQTKVDGLAKSLLSPHRIQDAYIGQDPVWIISATRDSEEVFWASSALGVSLKRHMKQDARIVPHVYYENKRGLSEVFNEAVAMAPDNALVIFAHDDIWLDQHAFVHTIQEGLAAYDVIGVAGTARMLPKQPAWLFTDLAFTWEQSAFLRGKVAHGQHPFGLNTYFGAEKGDCVLMDGVLMAAYKRTLTQANVRHDPQFDFEFYDLDFCRTASQAGLKLGIWPINLTHQSMGNFGKQRWRDKYQTYLSKWEEGETATGTPMTPELNAALEEVFALALQHQQAGDLQTATQLYHEILAVAPQSAAALFNLGLIAWTQSHQQDAVTWFKQAHTAHPTEWEYLQHYLIALQHTAGTSVFAAACEQAMALPEHREAVQQLAAALQLQMQQGASNQAGQTEQATTSDLSMQPDAAQQQALLTAFEQQQYEQMEQALQAHLLQYPQWLAGWKMLADVQMLQKKDASEAAQQALALNAQDPQEHCYYGIVLKAKGDLPAAAATFRQAIALKPDYAAAYNNLGTVLKDLGQVQEAIEYFKCALALQPAYADCFSNLLFCMTHAEHIDQAALMQAHQAYADLYEAPLKAAWLPHSNTRIHRPLNIGWVSADFRAHSVAHFMQPLLAELATETSLRLVAYANQPLIDHVTTQMQGYFAKWHEVSSWSDQALAEQIRADGIDILIDLSGHTSGNRLLTFARKPAPIQVSWLGYLNTTGLSSMDYYLADSYLLPAGQFDDQFTEKLVQLPVNATFTPDAQAPAVNALPALSNGYLTFGCFNRMLKITQATVQQWAALMHALPDSRLVIGGVGEGESTQHLQAWFAEAGIAAERIRYYPRADMATYLGYYHEVDICLDTFPSNGVTTTAHALWMGVPTLCVAGDRLASRGAMALMQHMGLMQFIAPDQDSLIKQNLDLCADLTHLAACRAQMREHFSASLLAKPGLQAQALRQVLCQMWLRWCAQQAPLPIQSRWVDADPSQPILHMEPEMLVEDMDTVDAVKTLPPVTTGGDLMAAAQKLQAEGELTQAADIYLAVLKAEPQHAEASFQLGWIETQTHGVTFALPRLEQAVMLQPEVEQYWVTYIDALMMQGNIQSALLAVQQGQQHGLTAASAAMLINDCMQTASQQFAEQNTVDSVLVSAEQLQQQLFAEEKTETVTEVAPVSVASEQPLQAQPVQWFNKTKPVADQTVFPESWLKAYPQALMIEYTSRCNLRCKYCSKSNPGDDQIPGRNMDMTTTTVDAVIHLIEQSSYSELLLAGTGESTFHPHWREDFPRMIQAGKSRNPACYIHVNSNFAAKYEDEDWAVFAQLDGIVISIDTADRQLTREVRAKSDLGLIIYNITRLQTYCQFHGLKLPKLTVNVTLYHEATAGLPELMAMLSNLPIKSVTISDLMEHEATEKHAIRPLHNDDPVSFKQAVEHLKHAIEIADKQQGFRVTIQPHLLERIEAMAKSINAASIDQGAVEVDPQLSTKLCLQPWTRFTLAADAAIFPCCMTVMDPVGNIDSGKDEEGLNGEDIRAFRHALLRGDMPTSCKHCTNAPDVSPQTLQAAINELSRKANA